VTIRIRTSDSVWTLLTRHPTPDKLTLLRAMGSVWSFQDSRDGRLYRCEIDSDHNERWFVQHVQVEREWIYPSEAARLLGVSRQAISNAISKLYRPDVLAAQTGERGTTQQAVIGPEETSPDTTKE